MYRYNKETLTFERTSNLKKNVAVGAVFMASIGLAAFSGNTLIYEPVVSVNVSQNNFTEERLIRELKKLNLRFPHIALAQAKIESGGFKSPIFRENNNLFGMKQARQRVTTARGTNRGHAYYDTWEDCVTDYALWCAAYANKCRTEDEFYNLLSTYAEAQHYEEALRKMIEKNNLKEKF
jgi:uncharacterized FlgJ-related protein